VKLTGVCPLFAQIGLLLIIGRGRQALGYLFDEGKIVLMDKKSPVEGLSVSGKIFTRASCIIWVEYNYERPHEALNMKTLASLYHPSLRTCPTRVPEIEYHGDVIYNEINTYTY
jgi:hypothetical protein